MNSLVKKMRARFIFSTRSGVIILTLMIVTSIMVLSIAAGLAVLSMNANQAGFYQGYSERVFFNLDGCAEEALAKLNRNNIYSGETVTVGGTLCTIAVTGTDPVRTINITGTNSDYTRKLQIGVTIFPTFVVNNWQELAT